MFSFHQPRIIISDDNNDYLCVCVCVRVCMCRALVEHPDDDNVNHLSLEDTGAGGLDELLDRLMDSKAQYALGTPTHNDHTSLWSWYRASTLKQVSSGTGSST